MSVPYFASPFGRPPNGAVGAQQHELLGKRKRKRTADYPEETNDDDFASLSDETFPKVTSEVEQTTKSRSFMGTGLRQQHYSVVTSLLHRCILEKDYQRASRAWGMLLRMEFNGHPLDIRAQDRWGIGAELLLHSEMDLVNKSVHEDDSPGRFGKRPLVRDSMSIQKGLMKAKDYYERLILQFPYRKAAPDSTSSLTFYPVMFSVWIHSIQLRYKIAIQETLNQKDRNSAVSDDYANKVVEHSNTTDMLIEGQYESYQMVVQDAQKILERLNELLISPPYSDHSGLWKIQGMLYLWIDQLSDHLTFFVARSDGSGERSGSATAVQRSSPLAAEPLLPLRAQSQPEDRLYERQESAALKAREAFSRALALDGTLDTQMRGITGL